jgi:hypothetical protein
VRKITDVVLTSNSNLIRIKGSLLVGATAAGNSTVLMRLNFQNGEVKTLDLGSKICRVVAAAESGVAAVLSGDTCVDVLLTDESHTAAKLWSGFLVSQFLDFLPGGDIVAGSQDQRSISVYDMATGQSKPVVEMPEGRYVRYAGYSAATKMIYVVANSAGRYLEALYGFALP